MNRYWFLTAIGNFKEKQSTCSPAFITHNNKHFLKKSVEDEIYDKFKITNQVITFFKELKVKDYLDFIGE